jgi:hypothetical protein
MDWTCCALSSVPERSYQREVMNDVLLRTLNKFFLLLLKILNTVFRMLSSEGRKSAGLTV